MNYSALRGPDRLIRTVGVIDPAVRKDLSHVKPGDKLPAVDIQVPFAAIERKA